MIFYDEAVIFPNYFKKLKICLIYLTKNKIIFTYLRPILQVFLFTFDNTLSSSCNILLSPNMSHNKTLRLHISYVTNNDETKMQPMRMPKN